MPRAVLFDRYGDPEVLYIGEVAPRSPDPDSVQIEVRSAGVNPGEAAIRSGAMADQAPGTFPSGQGTEFAGRVTAIGEHVAGVAVGDAVIGFSDGRDAQGELLTLPAANVLPMPWGIGWDTAAASVIAGATATAMIRAVGLQPGDTVVVSGGAGGVGFAAVQLALRRGATVIATSSDRDRAALAALGAAPVVYGDGVGDRIRAAADSRIDAFLDTHGGGQADVALGLGVDRGRVDSIIDFEAGARLGIKNEGMYQLQDIRAAVREFVAAVASGAVWAPVRGRFALERVQEAYAALSAAPGVGKIVLAVSSDDID